MKKLVSLFTLIIIASMLLVACGGTAAPTAEPPKPTEKPTLAPPPPATEAPPPVAATEAPPAATEAPVEVAAPALPEVTEPTTIELWQHDSGGKIKGLKAVIDEFQKQYPNITVTQTVIPYDDYQTKMAASVPAGSGPDVAMSYYGWIALWNQAGFIIPLPDSVSAIIEKDFVPFKYITAMDGKQYGVLTSVRNFALFYNPLLLKEAGFDKPPATWDEFVTVAKACTKTDSAGNITQAGYYFDFGGDGWNWWRALIEAYGGQAFSEDGKQTLFNVGDGARAAWQYLIDFTLKDKVSMPAFFEGELEGFAAGKSCMTPELTFSVGFMRDNAAPGVEWKVAPMPAGPKGAFTQGSSWPLVLTSKAANDPNKLAAATLFLAFMASAKGQELYTDVTGEIPSRNDMVGLEKYTSNANLKPFIDQMAGTKAPFWVDELKERQCAIDMYDAVITTGADPMTTLDSGAACDQKIRDEFFAK
jgi:multiple sugar transport system substrate-binding protein